MSYFPSHPPPTSSFLHRLPPSPSSSIHHTEHHALISALPLTPSIHLLLKWTSYCSTRVALRHPSTSPPSSLTLHPPSPFLPSLPVHALSLPAANVSGTSPSRCAVMYPPIRKNTHSAFGVPPCWDYASSSLCLVSHILRVWSLLSGGTSGQLNIYGSASIQMFGNGESLWPENWHDLFVHNMQQGRCRACPQHVSVCMCVFCSGCVGRWCYCGRHIFRLWAFLIESCSYYLIDQPREILVAATVQTNRDQNQAKQSKLGVKPVQRRIGLQYMQQWHMHVWSPSQCKVLDLLRPVTSLKQGSETFH